MAGEWVTRRIGDLGKVITGKTPSTKVPEYFGGEYPFITIPDLDGRRDISTTARSLSQRGADELRGCQLPAGAVMMSCIATIGKCGMTVRPSFTNQQINSVVCGDDVSAKYLYYVFTTLAPALEAAGGGGSVYTNVSKSRFADIILRLPPLLDQRAIAHILGALDDKIELNRRMNRTLEEMARAIFKSWFVDFDPVRAKAAVRREHPKWTDEQVSRAACPNLKPEIAALFPDSFEASELGEIPKGWRVGSIYDIADVIYGAPFASAQFNTEGIGQPLIRIRDLPNELPSVWTPEVHPKRYKVCAGDIAVGMDGEFRAYLWGGPEAWLNQRICVFKPKPGWTAAFVRNTIIDQLARVEATETATTVIHLGKADIDLFRALLPTQPLRDMFNSLVQPWYDRIVRAKCESRTLAALRDALLPKLISGELRVPDAERIVGRAV